MENLEKQFGIKFENLVFKDAKIEGIEKNLKQNLDEKLKIHEKFLLEKLNISNRLIIIITVIIAPIAIASIGIFVIKKK